MALAAADRSHESNTVKLLVEAAKECYGLPAASLLSGSTFAFGSLVQRGHDSLSSSPIFGIVRV